MIDCLQVTAPPLAKGKISASIKLVNAKTGKNRRDKLVGTCASQRVIKPDMNHARWPHLAKQSYQKPVFFAAVGKMEWCLILTKKLAWMRIETNDRWQQAIAPRRSDRSVALSFWRASAQVAMEAYVPLMALLAGRECGGEEGTRLMAAASEQLARPLAAILGELDAARDDMFDQ